MAQKNRSTLASDIVANFLTGSPENITASKLRTLLADFLDSLSTFSDDVISQASAENGTDTDAKLVTAERLKQASQARHKNTDGTTTLTFLDTVTFRDLAAIAAIDTANAVAGAIEFIRLNGSVNPFPLAGVELIGDDNFQSGINLDIVFLYKPDTSVIAWYLTPPYTSNNPMVMAVHFTGTLGVGEDLTIEGDYFGGLEGTSTYRVLRGDTSSGPFVPVSGATTKIYTQQLADQGKYLAPGYTPVSQLPAVGTEVIGSVVGPIPAGPFNELSVPNIVSFLDGEKPLLFTTVADTPLPRMTDADDANGASPTVPTARHWESIGSTNPAYNSATNEIQFVNTEANQLRIITTNPAPIVANDPRTVALRIKIDAGLGTAYMYLDFRDSTKYTIIDNHRIGVNNGTTIHSATLGSLVDGLWHTIIFRSSTANGLDVRLDGVSVLSDASHKMNYDMSAALFGRTGLAAYQLRGGLAKYLLTNDYMDISDVQALETKWATLNP